MSSVSRSSTVVLPAARHGTTDEHPQQVARRWHLMLQVGDQTHKPVRVAALVIEGVDTRVLDGDLAGEGVDLAILVVLGMVRDDQSRPAVHREKGDELID